MPLKFKIVFYNFMIFLILFDLLYLMVWLFSIEMNPIKTVIVAVVTSVIMPWARSAVFESRRKVIVRSYAFDLFRKYQNRRSN